MPFDFTDVAFAQVSHHFGRRRALNQVSFSCSAGEVVGLLGPNGAGKSTLLSIAATLVRPASGVVRYGTSTASEIGQDVRGRIGLLAHDLHVYAELSARENLEFFARLYRVDAVSARVTQALDRAGLAERGDDAVSGFSRGMRQRLALERTLLHEPRLVLLDEPFTGLDDVSVGMLLDRLRRLKAAGRIVVLATHDLDLVQDVLDRAVVLLDGRLGHLEASEVPLRERYRRHVGRRA